VKSSFRTSLLLITVLVTILATGCIQVQAPATQSSAPVAQAPQGNRPPVISGLTAANNQLSASATTEVQVVAADPDGDKVSITWQCTGGNINGQGYVVTWQAPKNFGTYTITAIANDTKGGSAQQSVTISVGANQSPQISSISAKPQTVAYGQQSIVTCQANDPDGDVLTYVWKADEGNISGQGPTVTWNAPSKDGNFNVYVTVADNKGGEAKQNVTINVAGATKTVTLTVIQEETGTVAEDNRADNSVIRAGDYITNENKEVGLRAFFSFNIFSLNKTEIKDAKLIFGQSSIAGDPFIVGGAMSLNGLMLRKVQYSGRLPSFNIIGTSLNKQSAALFQSPNTVDVTPEVVYLVNTAADRFQLMAAFDKITNSNGSAEFIKWTDVKLQVSYTEK
jgi:hypothetical protein